MSNANETLVRRWFEEVWNKGRADAIDEMFACEGIAHGLSEESSSDLCGPEGFKPFFESFRRAFPDLQVTVEDTVVEGDKIAARCSVRATHTGRGFRNRAKPETSGFHRNMYRQGARRKNS